MNVITIKQGGLVTLEGYNPRIHGMPEGLLPENPPAPDPRDSAPKPGSCPNCTPAEAAPKKSNPVLKTILAWRYFYPGTHELIIDDVGNYCGFRDTRTGELIEGHDPVTGEDAGLPTAFYVRHDERDGIVALVRLFGVYGGPETEMQYDEEHYRQAELDEILRDTMPPMIGTGQDGAALGRASSVPDNPQSAIRSPQSNPEG